MITDLIKKKCLNHLLSQWRFCFYKFLFLKYINNNEKILNSYDKFYIYKKP